MRTALIAGICAGLLLANTANACCSYGCCDCSCVTRLSADDADGIMRDLSALLRSRGINPQTIELVVRTDGNQQRVLFQGGDGRVEQPTPARRSGQP